MHVIVEEEGLVLCVLRRYKRKPLSRFAASSKYRIPEERAFDITAPTQKMAGRIVYTEDGGGRSGKATTPWGTTTISLEGGFLRNGRRGFLMIVLEGRTVANVKPGISRLHFSFPERTEITFDWLKEALVQYSYRGEACSVTIAEEEGEDLKRALPFPPSKDLLKGLPKEDRPRTTETNHYTQYTIRKSGTVPIDERDLIVVLSMYLSWDLLQFEQFAGI